MGFIHYWWQCHPGDNSGDIWQALNSVMVSVQRRLYDVDDGVISTHLLGKSCIGGNMFIVTGNHRLPCYTNKRIHHEPQYPEYCICKKNSVQFVIWYMLCVKHASGMMKDEWASLTHHSVKMNIKLLQ
jgi:hypothetical protein